MNPWKRTLVSGSDAVAVKFVKLIAWLGYYTGPNDSSLGVGRTAVRGTISTAVALSLDLTEERSIP